MKIIYSSLCEFPLKSNYFIVFTDFENHERLLKNLLRMCAFVICQRNMSEIYTVSICRVADIVLSKILRIY